MAKNLKKLLSAVLAFAMVAGIALPAFAEAATIWQGSDVKLSFDAGVDPYIYAIAQDPSINRYYYETSNHVLKKEVTGGGAVHIFPMVDTTKINEDAWTPDGIYQSGVSNYDVMYCCDAVTGTADGIYYKRVNLEDSEYVSIENAKKLRAIVENAYPYVSVEEARAALKEAGFAQADDLDRSELIAATQAAIWTIANPDSGDSYRYNKTATTAQKLTWGGYMHEFAGEIENFTDSTTKRQYLSNPNGVGDRVNALIDFYLNMKGVDAEAGQIVITKLDVSNSKVTKADGLYPVEINVSLNHGADGNDNVTLYVYVDGEPSTSVDVTSKTNYTVKLNANANSTIKVVVSGTQTLERGVYFYQPEPQDIDGDGIATSREVSQNLIGVGSGETPVYAEETITLRKIDKYEEDFDGKYVDVTLEVNGKVDYKTEGCVDIVIALGAGIANKQNTVNSIYALVEPLFEQGINVKLGLIAVEHYDDVAMELTTITAGNYKEVIELGLNTIINMPAGPTNLHGNIVAAKAMLDADTDVPAENKFFYVIGTGRTYNYDNAEGVPTTIINKLNHNGNTYYYWGHYLWQSQRGQHTSLYRVPTSYNNDFAAYWADVEKWVAADGDTYAYSFPNYDTTNEQWFNEYMDVNGKKLNDASNKVASSPFGWLIVDLTNSGTAAIGSGALPQNALNYERAQYEAYYAYKAMVDAGYTCQTLCSESVSYQNYSPYMSYLGVTPSIQLGHSFMDHMAKLSGQEASTVLFNLIDDNGNYEMATNFFAPIDTTKLVGTGESKVPFVEDFIGFGKDYNFDFTGNKLVLTFNGVEYDTNEIATAEGATASYEFVDANGKVGFTMDYFKGENAEEERFVWNFLMSLTGEDTVTLEYQLELVTKSAEVGIHVAYTNQSATLYPNGDREYGQLFPVPEVQYTNYPPLNGDKTSHDTPSPDRFEINVTVPGGDPEKVHDEVILMVDGSYSMDNEWPAMKEAIITIGEAVLNGNGNTQLTLMAFGMGDNEVLVHVKSAEALANALGELPGNLLYGRSSTNCESGFTGVAEYIANHDETLGKVDVIFISDGNLNTDETPRAFDKNWKTWTKFGALTVAQVAFEETVLYGENLPAAFTTVFGDRFDGASAEEILDRAFGGEVTDEEFIAFAEQLWTDVYAYSGLTRGVEYPVSDAERAFVKYDKEMGTYIQDLFYYTTYKSAYVTYNDRWTRTPVAADALAAMDAVNALYVVDYDGYTAWMDTGITSEKATFVQSNGITGLLEALKETLTELSKTPYNDVVVTDYMSKWVNIDLSTLKIVDNRTGETIWSAAEGWLINENRPTAQEVPVIAELVNVSDYAAGGSDVEGNISGDIYKLTWYVKDGALLRSDNYKLVYEVTVDIEEPGFVYGKDLPANGNTYLEYEGGRNEIKVPNVSLPVPTYTVTYLNNGVEMQKTVEHLTGDMIPGCDKPADFTADGYRYTFVGWELKSGTEGSDSTIGTTDLVYVAVYKKTIDRITISFENGDASNISFMLIDKATGEVEFLYKIDIENQTSFEIPTEEGKISAVFVKQSTSGMFWFAEEVDEDLQQAVIDCLKANNPSYKGHNAVCFGAGDHELEFKKNKFVTYTFDGAAEVTVEPETEAETETPVVDEPVVEEPVVEEPVVEEPVVEEETKKNNGNNGNGNGNNKNKDKNKNKNKNK